LSNQIVSFPNLEERHKIARILVVDDAPANLVALQAVLEPLKQEVLCVSSGEEALKHLLTEDFALIVMDVQMPGLDGLETARLVRARERTRHIPIIFVTALSREAAYVMEGYASGGVDYLLKPIDPLILRSKVSVFVELYLRGESLKEQALQLADQQAVREEMERAAALEQQLVGIVGHDIRSPLSAILATAQHQLQAKSNPESQKSAFVRIAHGAERISKIVNLLLDFTRARVGAGIPIIKRRGELLSTVTAVVEEVRAARPEAIIETHFPEQAVEGHWDLDRLSQVLANLLDNALKHGDATQPVHVEVVDSPRGGAQLAVTNRGPVIPPSALPGLFEPFCRGEVSEENNSRSLGLGLYISRSIVHAHGGEIQVSSDKNEGTRFEVVLPKGTPVVAPSVVDATADARG
jgi:signal transduction histidine kinase